MKPSPRSLFCALAFGLVLTPAVSLADYQPAEAALERLENCVNLTAAQEKQALSIFQNLKDVMDDMDPAERPIKGAQSRKDAMAAIRAILTPEQQAIYDRTPQRLGGGGRVADPAMSALRLKVSTFVRNAARTSPDIATQVGTVQKIVLSTDNMSMTVGPTGSQSDDPATHPDSGTNIVRVTGSKGVQVFKISWKMDAAGEMTLIGVEKQKS